MRALCACRRVLLVLLITGGAASQAATPGPELQRAVRAGTVEVVVHKGESDRLRYEKPLPLELIPFAERNDAFWSVGTAFLLSPRTYVTAAHVLTSGLGSSLGAPLVRDADGKVHALQRIVKYSLRKDFAVFTVADDPGGEALPVGPAPPAGEPVFTVGNALGEGVVIRDGLLTSETPEEQDGRWKWLRYSAPASPGNSGGPLLDAAGHVFGVVTAKSPNENLNYALPLALVLQAGSAAVDVDSRESFALANLRAQRVTRFTADFPLPQSYADFARRLIAARVEYYKSNRRLLLKEQEQWIFPLGQSDRLLASSNKSVLPGVIRQKEDDSWYVDEGQDGEESELPDGSKVSVGGVSGAVLFRVTSRDPAKVAVLQRDKAALMDALLRALKMPRKIGPQAIRITSLGQPESSARHVDRAERRWQVLRWSLGYTDLQVIAFVLPTPSGSVGLLRFATAVDQEVTVQQLQHLADYFQVGYAGSVTQWRAFLADPDLAPPALGRLKLATDADGLAVQSPTASLRVPQRLLATSDRSELSVLLSYVPRAGGLAWEITGMVLSEDEAKPASFVGVYRQAKPHPGAGEELNERWKKMSGHQGEFTGEPQHDSSLGQFWTRSVMGDAAQEALYEVVLNLQQRSLMPREVTERRDQLLQGVSIGELRR